MRYGDYEVLKKKTAAQKKISAADTILHNPHVRPIVDQAGGLGERKDAPDIDELY